MVEDCLVCLEKLNNNVEVFCCSKFHKNCIRETIRTTGKCPICRFKYDLYEGEIEDGDNNLEQVKYKTLKTINGNLNKMINEWKNIAGDLLTRVYMLEERTRNGGSSLNNSLINQHSIRISQIEEQINNL